MNCFGCGVELKKVFEKFDDDSWQRDNALIIKFKGGYGMFIDPMSTDEYPDIIICHECAHKLCAVVPWIEDFIDPRRSHAHTQEYKEENPDHWGWDYMQN